MKTIPVLIAKKLNSGKLLYGIVAVQKPRENQARIAVRREINTPGGHDKVDQAAMWLGYSHSNPPVRPPAILVMDSNELSRLDIDDSQRKDLQDWMVAEQLRVQDEKNVEVLVAADAKTGTVVMQFPQPITYIRMPAVSVRTIIERLKAELALIEKEEDRAPETDGSADQTRQHDHPS